MFILLIYIHFNLVPDCFLVELKLVKHHFVKRVSNLITMHSITVMLQIVDIACGYQNYFFLVENKLKKAVFNAETTVFHHL